MASPAARRVFSTDLFSSVPSIAVAWDSIIHMLFVTRSSCSLHRLLSINFRLAPAVSLHRAGGEGGLELSVSNQAGYRFLPFNSPLLGFGGQRGNPLGQFTLSCRKFTEAQVEVNLYIFSGCQHPCSVGVSRALHSP
jgi:hypothetical protein